MNVELLTTFLIRIFEKYPKRKPRIHSSTNFKSGCETIENLIENKSAPDLILTDFYLDYKYTGIDIYDYIINRFKQNNLPLPNFILVSGEKPKENDSNKFKRILQKPFKYSDLVKKLDFLIDIDLNN